MADNDPFITPCIRVAALITIITVSFSSITANAQNELVPLQEYMETNSKAMNDPPTFQYVLMRCSATYYAMSTLFKNDVRAERIEMQETLHQKGETFFGLALRFQLVIDKDQKPNSPNSGLERVKKDTLTLTKIYTERIKDASLRLGDFWKDKIVKGDYDKCEQLNSSSAK